MAYTNYRTVTIDHTKVSATLSDHQVYVELDLGANVQSPSGYDVVFSDDASITTQYPHEIVGYASGIIKAWVKIPSVSSSTDTTFYVHYNDASVSTSQEDLTSLWPTGFKGVWHFENSITDSSQSGNDGTDNGSLDYSSGKVSHAREFDDSTSKNFYVPHDSSLSTTSFTLLAWVNSDLANSSNTVFVKGRPSGSDVNNYCMRVNSDGTIVAYFTSSGNFSVYQTTSGSISANTWTLIGFRYVSNTPTLFKNGSTISGSWVAGTNNTPDTTTTDLTFGYIANYGGLEKLDGYLDECIIYAGSLSNDWIATYYNNTNSPSTFVSLGSEQSGGTEVNDERSAELTGYTTTNSTRDAEVRGNNTSNSERSAEITGAGGTASNRSAELTGYATTNDTRDAELTGSNTSNSERAAEITGYGTGVNDERNAEITGEVLFDKNNQKLLNAGSIILPLGWRGISYWNTSSRPSDVQPGTYGLNVTTNNIEIYNGSAWRILIQTSEIV